jgi:1,2-diacylglycerol 3-beta-galactosyltransferase
MGQACAGGGDVTTKRHILILTTDAGLGHRSAAESLAAAFRRRYARSHAVEIVNPLEDERVPDLLREGQDDYSYIVEKAPRLYELGYRMSNGDLAALAVRSALTVALFRVMRDLVTARPVDAVVSTYPTFHAPLQAVRVLEDWDVPIVSVVTDLVNVHRLWWADYVDLCVVATDAARERVETMGGTPERIAVIGIPVDLAIADESRSPVALRETLAWEPDVMTLLAVGGKRVDHLMAVLDELNHSDLALQLALVAGGDDALYERFQETEWHGPVHCYNFVEDLPRMMLASDVMLCKAGGLIVSEGLACGVPLLLADVLPGQEEGNAEYVVEGGAGLRVEDPTTALEALQHWAEDPALLADRAAHARRLGAPEAAYEIVERVESLVAAPRPPTSVEATERRSLEALLRRHDVI